MHCLGFVFLVLAPVFFSFSMWKFDYGCSRYLFGKYVTSEYIRIFVWYIMWHLNIFRYLFVSVCEYLWLPVTAWYHSTVTLTCPVNTCDYLVSQCSDPHLSCEYLWLPGNTIHLLSPVLWIHVTAWYHSTVTLASPVNTCDFLCITVQLLSPVLWMRANTCDYLVSQYSYPHLSCEYLWLPSITVQLPSHVLWIPVAAWYHNTVSLTCPVNTCEYLWQPGK